MITRRERAILGIGAALAVAVPIALAAHVRARCADDLGARLTALAGVPSRIAGVDAGLTGTVRLTDVAIGDLFRARAVEARVALPSLLDGRLAADEIQVEAPRLRATVANGEVDLVRVMRRIAARRPGGGGASGAGPRSVRRIVVTEGDLVVTIAGAGTLSASAVELHPRAGGVRVLTGAVRLDVDGAGIAADAGFARTAADVSLPAVRLERLVATGGAGTGHGPGGPPLAIGDATLTYGTSAGAPSIASIHGTVDDHGVPRPIRVALARDAVAIAVEHAPLAAAAPWLPAGLVLDDARLTGAVDVAHACDGEAGASGRSTTRPGVSAGAPRCDLAVSVRGDLAGLVIRSAAIADRPVPIDGSGELTATWRGSALDATARLATGKATVAVTAHLDRGTTGWDHGDVSVTVPPTPCLDLLDAVPRALRGASAGLTVEGTASAKVAVTVRGTAEVSEAVAVDADVDVTKCKVLAEAPAGDPARLGAVREHAFPDGSHRRVGRGADGWVTLDSLPSHVSGAFVAAEDARFWDHDGFDVDQIARSLEVDLRERRLARGGSTISQQLVKNVYLGPERTFARKLEEAILTWRVEATTSKRTILEQYLNVIELGPGVFGIDAAARHWFDTSPSHLSTREAAFLAALTPEPRSMTARIVAAGELDRRSRERLEVVLRAMKRAGVISTERYESARDDRIRLRDGAVHP
jgi:hypothetical protein